ncbi:MAG TPA: hypothetical protein VFD30_13625 [Terriglobia bacterium]|jgi:hypothetical protein|nr:hypothetical protein [Terriglobia bacterium]
MKTTCLYAAIATVVLATPVLAQNRISGTSKCSKPDTAYALEVGDRPHHLFVMTKATCTWDKPVEMAGTESKGYETSVFNESWATRGRMLGYVVSAFADGDKTFVRVHGRITLKDGKQTGSEGAWNYTGGTGKFVGIKGKGTFKCSTEGEGAACTIEGEYGLPGR